MREDVVRMLGFDAINEFASFVHWATIMFPLYMFVTILYRSVYLFWRGAPSRDPFFFFVLYVATIRAGGYAKTSIQRPATAMFAHNKMHASKGG